MHHELIAKLIYDLLLVLTAGLVSGAVCKRFGVSMLVGYLVIGAVIGGGSLGLVSQGDHDLEYLAQTGVLLLLFSIGIEFSLGDLVRMGRHLVVGGTAQMTLVAAAVILTAVLLGESWRAGLLFGAAIAFSSTVLVFKALEEWGQAGSPHGRRALGILLFQDAALVPLVLLVPLLTGSGPGPGGLAFVVLGAKTFGLLAAVPAARAVIARWVAPQLARLRSVELLVLLTMIVMGGMTLAAYRLGLPPMIGAFAAGLMLNGNRLTRQIDAVILPFRETFAAVFFVSLGTLVRFDTLWSAPLASFGMLMAVVLLKTVAAAVALRLTRLRWSAAFGMGLGLAQVGEFAFVLLLVGIAQGVIEPFGYNLIMFVAVGTLIATPQLLKIGLCWAERAPVLERELVFRPVLAQDAVRRAVVIGVGPIGGQVASRLETKGYDASLIDLSPINVHSFAQQGFRTVVGDATQAEVLKRAGITQCSLVVVTVPDDDSAADVISAVRTLNAECTLIVRCRLQGNTTKLQRLGADEVLSEESQIAGTLIALLDRLA